MYSSRRGCARPSRIAAGRSRMSCRRSSARASSAPCCGILGSGARHFLVCSRAMRWARAATSRGSWPCGRDCRKRCRPARSTCSVLLRPRPSHWRRQRLRAVRENASWPAAWRAPRCSPCGSTMRATRAAHSCRTVSIARRSSRLANWRRMPCCAGRSASCSRKR